MNSPKKPLKIWVNKSLILSDNRPIPFLMHISPPDTKPELEFWNSLRESLINQVEICYFDNLQQAGTLVAIPHELQSYGLVDRMKEVLDFKQQILASNRIPVLFTGAVEYNPHPKEIAFCLSTYRTNPKTIPTPAWLYDYGKLISPLEKTSDITVGFVGQTRYPGRINQVLSYLPKPHQIVNLFATNPWFNRILPLGMRSPIARALRERTINTLNQNQDIKCSFILRDKYFFNAPLETKQKAREEYLQNLQNNAYILCMRGTENFSYRLYEVMAVGRIPVIVDTQMKFPDLGEMKWQDFSIIVPFAKIDQIGESIISFHNSLSEAEFKQVCQKSRAAFEYLMPEQFIMRYLKNLALLSDQI